MKKLAIMFVMLLGSVATMQAQSFNFTCDIHGFTIEQQNDLEGIGFSTTPDLGYYQSFHNEDYIIFSAVGETFDVYQDSNEEGQFNVSFEIALETAAQFLDIPPVTGFVAPEVFVLMADGFVLVADDNTGTSALQKAVPIYDTAGTTIIGMSNLQINFIPIGQVRDLHNAAGDVIGTETIYYSTSGHNVPLMYSVTAAGIVAQVLALNP